MKIVLVIPSLTSGGAERVISVLANTWSNLYDITLIVWNNDIQFYKINDKITIYDLKFKYNNKIEKIYQEISVLYKMRKIIKNISPTFVLSFLTHCNISVLLSTLFLKNNVIISERNSPEIIKLQLSKSKIFLRKLLYPYAKGIIVQSNLAKNFIKKEFQNSRVISLQNPIKDFNYIVNKNIIKEKIILNIGRLTEQKGQHNLIKIFSQLNLKDWKLIILGEGKLRQSLEEQVQKLKLTENIFLPGEVKNVDEYILKSSIFAFTSNFEGFPNALAESMSLGLTPISYDCNTGPSELIKNNYNGYLIELNNEKEFLMKLKQLTMNESLRKTFSKNAIKVRENLSCEVIANEYLKFAIGEK